MDAATRNALEDLNRDFYETHAASFSSTRDHPWPGWERVSRRLPSREIAVLDAGCGNGRFARFLAETGHVRIRYTGVDTSERLLMAAGEAVREWRTASTDLERCDLFEADLPAGPFDAIVLFGVLHHVPGFDERAALLARLGSRLAPGGFLAATLWRFALDERAERHTRDFASHPVAVDPAQLEPGDRLLEWRSTAGAVRYCHFVDDAEVDQLITRVAEDGLQVADHFRSDGRSGDLNEYLVWTANDQR